MQTFLKKIEFFKNRFFFYFIYVFSFFPIFSKAQTGGVDLSAITCTTRVRNFKELVMNMFIGCVVNPLIPIMVSVAALTFMWGVFKFIRSEGSDKQKAKGFIIWGLVGLTVMLSLWGLVNLLQYTFRLDNTNINTRPINPSQLSI